MNIRPSNLLQGDALERLPPAWKTRALRTRLAIGGALVLLAALLAWRILGSFSEQTRSLPPPPVHVAVARQKDVTGFEHSIGTVVPLATVQVTSMVAGPLFSAGFSEGQIVKQGQQIFQIDPRPFAAALAQSKATLARDTANTISAEHDRDRFTTLAAQGAASAMQRDQAVAAAKADEATVAADKAAVQMAELNLGYTRIVSPITGKTGP